MEELRTLCKHAEGRLAGLLSDFDRITQEIRALQAQLEQRGKEVLAAQGVVAGIRMALGEAPPEGYAPDSMLTLRLAPVEATDPTD